MARRSMFNDDPEIEPAVQALGLTDETATTSPPDYEVYSPGAVGLSALLGSIVAGGVVMAINYRRLGEPKTALNTLVLSLIGMIGLSKLMLVLPENFPDSAFHFLQMAVMYQLAKRLQGPKIDAHLEIDGHLASRWRAAGISLLSIPLALGCVLLATLL